MSQSITGLFGDESFQAISCSGTDSQNLQHPREKILYTKKAHTKLTLKDCRYHDAFDCDESDRNYDMRSTRLRYDYDTTTTKN